MVEAFVFDAYGTLFDVQSVAEATERAFPGRGIYITQVWRLKQLEYSWLRTMSGLYADFGTVTRESLAYAVGTLGLTPEPGLFDEIVGGYDRLTPYPDAAEGLGALAGYRRAILSNGSPAMLAALVAQSGLGHHLEATISVDPARAFKPDPRAYRLVEERLGVPPERCIFVTSNGFDVMGARSFGFRVARIERVPAAALTAELASEAAIGPAAMYQALRTQQELCGPGADVVVSSLAELPALVAALDGGG